MPTIRREGTAPGTSFERASPPARRGSRGAWLRVPATVASDVIAALALLLETGVDPCEASARLAEEAPRRARRGLLRLGELLSTGRRLSEAAAAAPELFADDDVEALERTHGDVRETAAALRAISGRLAAGADVRRQLVRGLGFSALVVLSFVLLGPASLLVTDSLSSYAWAVAQSAGWLALVLIGGGAVLAGAARQRGVRRVADAIIWRLPVLASAWVHHRRAVFCSALGHAMAAGADVDRAVESASLVCGDQALQRRGKAIVATATHTSGLAKALARHGAIHRADAILAVAAELASGLPDALATVAERCTMRRRSAIKLWTTTLGIGLVVAGTAMGASKVMDAYRSMSFGIDGNVPELDGLELPDLQVPLPALP